MKLSVITVNFNNKLGLQSTIESVRRQNCKDFEYIIVDGASNDGSVDLIKSNTECIAYWVSEPDSGIYNAMNKGVRFATGDYCLFLNSGDTLYCESTIAEILSKSIEADFVEGIICLQEQGGIFHYPLPSRTFSDYIYGVNNFHQASLIKRDLLLKVPYDETYRIAADLKFNIESIVVHNCSYSPLDVVISNYEGGGISRTVNHEDERNRLFCELIPQRILADYESMRFIKEWPGSMLWPFYAWISQCTFILNLKNTLKRIKK